MKKISSLFFIFILVFQSLAFPVHAMSVKQEVKHEQRIITLDHEDDEIPLLEERSNSSNLLITLRNGDQIEVLEEFEDFTFVEFVDSNSNKALQGFIQNEKLVVSTPIVDEESKGTEFEEMDETNNAETDEDNDEKDEDTNIVDEPAENDSSNQDEVEVDQETITEKTEKDSDNESKETAGKQDVSTSQQRQSETSQLELSVIGRRNPTNVRAEPSTKTDVIATFKQGEIINLKTSTIKDWFEVKVRSNGKEKVGYIHRKHVDNIVENQESFRGIGIKKPTNVRSRASTSSKVEKSLPIGSKIDLKTFSTYWYEAVEEGKTIGYIHKNHIGDTIFTKQDEFEGIGINSPTYVRTLPSTKARAEASLPIGSIMSLKTFSEHWFEVSLSDGKKGYVHKYHVGDTVNEKMDNFKGIGINSPTYVRELPSTKAKAEVALPIGSIIKLNTFSKHWYKVTLDNGKTGYVHKKHIGDTVNEKQDSFRGIGINSPTYVRTLPSTKAGAEVALPIGSIINLKTFSKHWYEVTLANGKTGYVHKKHIGDTVFTNQESFKGVAIKSSTNIRSLPSTQATVVARTANGTIINLKSLSKHWYEASIKVNGKTIKGYIHRNHFNFLGMALKPTTNIRESASTKVNVIHTLQKGQLIELKPFNEYWYEVTVVVNNKERNGYIHKKHVDDNPDQINHHVTHYDIDYYNVLDIQMRQFPQVSKSGSWINASISQVDYYLNPSNFKVNQNQYYQFLVLSQPAGLNAKELNAKILDGKGILEKKGQTFIDAGKKFSINEAYLISHALLETGNGTSELAQGVPVDSKGNVVAKGKEKHIVYNMYGINAFDSCPLECGAKKAFDEKWFTPEAAIIGGAEFIEDYIYRGQDTLYKMRWNPDSPGYPQYATDVGWAVKQTTSIAQIYQLLDNYVLVFDVPKYNNQPNSSGDPNKYIETFLEVTANSGLNIRTGAGTSFGSLGVVGKGTLLSPLFNQSNKIITKSADGHLWYNIYFNNQKAWVSGGENGTEYIKIRK